MVWVKLSFFVIYGTEILGVTIYVLDVTNISFLNYIYTFLATGISLKLGEQYC